MHDKFTWTLCMNCWWHWTHGAYGFEDNILWQKFAGVWPESQSYSDEGLDPIPAKWKGTCQKGEEFGPENCNK
jgi:hypothetical protein